MKNKIKVLLFIILFLIPLNFIFAVSITQPDAFDDETVNFVILEESGVKMYSDFSETKENDLGVVIPKNSVVESNARKYIENNIWLFVKYNNQNGWILLVKNGVSNNIASQDNKSKYQLASSTSLYENSNEGSKIVGNIPAGTYVTPIYSVGAWQMWFYVEYNGVKGWIKGQDSFVQESIKKVVLLNDTYVYDEPDGKKTNTKVSKDNILTLTAIKNTVNNNHTITYGLYNLDGKSVWILISGDNVDYAEQINSDILENETTTIVSGDKIYSSANSNANEVGVIDENTKITEAYKYKDSKGNDSYYIVSSSGNGWVLKAFYDYKEDNKSDKPNTDNNKTTDDNNAIIWIVCSVICVLIILAIILVVKKNKKEIQNKD